MHFSTNEHDYILIAYLTSDQLVDLAKKYHQRIAQLEDEKYDLEYAVNRKDYEISEMASKVNDMRGKL